MGKRVNRRLTKVTTVSPAQTLSNYRSVSRQVCGRLSNHRPVFDVIAMEMLNGCHFAVLTAVSAGRFQGNAQRYFSRGC